MKDGRKEDGIIGHRELTETEVRHVNNLKCLEIACEEMLDEMLSDNGADRRSVALAKTNIQTGFMWAVAAITKNED